jgi:hypothetical protein
MYILVDMFILFIYFSINHSLYILNQLLKIKIGMVDFVHIFLKYYKFYCAENGMVKMLNTFFAINS